MEPPKNVAEQKAAHIALSCPSRGASGQCQKGEIRDDEANMPGDADVGPINPLIVEPS